MSFIAVSIIEIYLFIFLINNSLFHRLSFKNDFIFIVVFSLLLLLFTARKGLLSKFLDNNVSVFLGKFSYSLYIMQAVGFVICRYYLWNNENFVYTHPYLNLFYSVLVCFVLGIVSHVFIQEKFSDKLLKAINNLKQPNNTEI